MSLRCEASTNCRSSNQLSQEAPCSTEVPPFNLAAEDERNLRRSASLYMQGIDQLREDALCFEELLQGRQQLADQLQRSYIENKRLSEQLERSWQRLSEKDEVIMRLRERRNHQRRQHPSDKENAPSAEIPKLAQKHADLQQQFWLLEIKNKDETIRRLKEQLEEIKRDRQQLSDKHIRAVKRQHAAKEQLQMLEARMNEFLTASEGSRITSNPERDSFEICFDCQKSKATMSKMRYLRRAVVELRSLLNTLTEDVPRQLGLLHQQCIGITASLWQTSQQSPDDILIENDQLKLRNFQLSLRLAELAREMSLIRQLQDLYKQTSSIVRSQRSTD